MRQPTNCCMVVAHGAAREAYCLRSACSKAVAVLSSCPVHAALATPVAQGLRVVWRVCGVWWGSERGHQRGPRLMRCHKEHVRQQPWLGWATIPMPSHMATPSGSPTIAS
jgi:hypothetical protein